MEDIYSQLDMVNLIRPVRDRLKSGAMKIEGGKLHIGTHYEPDRCWHLVKRDPDRQCIRWNEIYFQIYGVIPRACRGCWKVVVEVPHLAALFALLQEQERMDFFSKCGVDRRWQFGGYGKCVGFFYAPLGSGLNGGRNLYKAVKTHLDQAMKNPYNIFLKRGCTEMEQQLPSDQWDERADYFDAKEKLLDEWVVLSENELEETQEMRFNTHQNWIFWRAQLQDPTYHYFTGGNFFWPKPVTYHDSEHLASDFPDGILEGVDE